MTGSLAARGMVELLHTVWATLVPSTRTCSTARWSWSVANTATDNSGMTRLPPPLLRQTQVRSGHLTIGSSGDLKSKALDFRSPDHPMTRSPDFTYLLPPGFLPSNLP